jgi:STE24 endopeptidase
LGNVYRQQPLAKWGKMMRPVKTPMIGVKTHMIGLNAKFGILAAVLFASAAFAAPSLAASAPFDPEAATAAYISTLSGAAKAKSDAYFEGGYWLILWGAMITILAELIVLKTGLSARFRDWGEKFTQRKFVHGALYALPYSIAPAILALPWTIYTGFYREKQYDLTNLSFVGWAGEYAINFAIGTAAFMLILPLAFAGIRRSPKRWWLWGTGFTSLFIAFFIMIAPVFISPLFNEYTELNSGPVRDRIVAMAKVKNVPAEHIYVVDASKQTKRISANVSGLGPTIRISLNDNLLNRSSLPETASVMGHELGHYVLGHIWKLVISLSLIFGFAFWIASRAVPAIISRWGKDWGLRDDKDIAAVPVYAIVISVVMLLLTPVTNSIIRINESEADAFGLEVAREPDGFASIAMKLSEYRKIDPSPIEEILFYDHPSGATRVRMAMDWKAKNLGKTTSK